ncbi:unannotated protein [freshwater metagenome]|uniref:Unannotated protein n=1 Tax=freshwater metagenome TaxID=449393 RepID=A0A6J6SDY9_9ZZZZ
MALISLGVNGVRLTKTVDSVLAMASVFRITTKWRAEFLTPASTKAWRAVDT